MTEVSNRMPRRDPLLRVRDLHKHFRVSGSRVRKDVVARAVDGVSFDLFPGETLGLVGESGCGKSTLGKVLMGYYKPTSGKVEFEGREVPYASRAQLRPYRRNVQMVFQDPFSSLNPRMTVEQIVAEPLKVHDLYMDDGSSKVAEVIERVGLSKRYLSRYPRQFSGGQRQRIGIARALVLRPSLVILDEPVSALDVSIQAQIIELLQQLQEDLHLAYIFIAHDLSVVRHISDRVAVMYLGRLVETGLKQALFQYPRHPYTTALLSSVPVSDPELRDAKASVQLEGELPTPTRIPSGCRFRTRCWKSEDLCRDVDPSLELTSESDGHSVACHFPMDSNAAETLISP
jgi:oligopeptide/dipeptide ABC transporter ATP-binding protein